MRYLDTCSILLLVNRTDSLRTELGIRSRKNGDALVRREHGRFVAPVPALGEVVQMLHLKCGRNDESEAHSELMRMMRSGFMEPRYIRDGENALMLARHLVADNGHDDRDNVSAMDALVTATAAVDPECDMLYTTDNELRRNERVLETVQDWRYGMGYRMMKIQTLDNILN